MAVSTVRVNYANAGHWRRLVLTGRGKVLAVPRLGLATAASTSPDDTTTNNSYQLLQCSKLPTLHFQRSLPRLPIPLLPKTCERFLAAVQPLLTSTEYAETQNTVADFQAGEGVQLHALLKQQDADNKQTSYISAQWFDMYLSDRAPLPLNYNPLLVMNPDERPAYRKQVVRAANLVISSMRFWRALLNDQLEPEVYHMNAAKSDTPQFRQWLRLSPPAVATYVAYAFKAFPLDMSQYRRLFGVSRIPRLQKDELVQAESSRHILVLRRGNMYAVEVLNSDGYIEAPHVIHARLQAVVRLDETRAPASAPLGVLTAVGRDEWARARAQLCKNARNRQLLEQQVDAALFCLCLDTPADPQYDADNPVPLLKHLLAGEATNRWFDKSVSMLVAADGTAALNFEHSWGDGVAVLRYFNEIYKDTVERPYVNDNSDNSQATAEGGVSVLDFECDAQVQHAVASAKQQVANTQQTLQMHMLRSPHLSKQVCKAAGVSPDALMQLAFQLAYRQAYDGEGYVGSYESCSTAAFRHGRTETIRPCTMATKQLCDALLSKSGSHTPQALFNMLQQCSTLHGQLTKEAAMGQGFDRHLFALRSIAQQRDMSVPALYNTAAYCKLNYNIISTSTLSSNALLAGSFGPVVHDGLGIGYSIQNDECGAIVSSYAQQRCGQSYVTCLAKSFDDIRRIINANRK